MTKGSDFWASATSIPAKITATEPTPTTELTPGREAGELYSGWGRTAWWRITATEDTQLSFNLLKSTLHGEYTWCRLMIWQGSAVNALSLVAWEDGNDYSWESGISGDLPEVITNVTAGEVYFIQASVRDGYGDMDYVLQVGKVTMKQTEWMDGPEYEREGQFPSSNGAGGRYWGYGQPEWVEDDWALEPQPDSLRAAIAKGTEMQWQGPTINGFIGPGARVDARWHSNKPNPEYGQPGPHFPYLFDYSKYAGSGHSSAMGHRRISEIQNHTGYLPTSPVATWTAYEFESLRPTVLKKHSTFDVTIESFSHENTRPAITTAKVQLMALPVPPDDGTQTNNELALFTPDLTSTSAGPVIWQGGPGGASATTESVTVDMTPYMSAMGGTIVRMVISAGSWTPSPVTGNDFDRLNMLGSFTQTKVVYTMRNARVRFTYREVEGDEALPEPTGRPDIVRRRFVRA